MMILKIKIKKIYIRKYLKNFNIIFIYMSNYKAITGSSKIVHRNQGGGSKLQGIPSSTNLNTSAHVAFRNRNVVCPCNRDLIFCMNQLGGVGAGGIPGRSYAFAPSADGTHKQFYCGHRFNNYLNNNKHLIYQKSIELNIDNEEEDLFSTDRNILNVQRSNVVHSERAKPTSNISIGKIIIRAYITGYKIHLSSYLSFYFFLNINFYIFLIFLLN